jgi:tetraacyldisaccharide 4'-kinase
MILIRKLLFPFAILYGLITTIRNFLYDKGILKSYSFDIPIIAVGNLSVGGTGKTPQIENLIRLLSPIYKVAVLSRGYKRKSEGFILADETATAEILGDEPFQMFQKFPQVQFAVDADRRNGISTLLSQKVKPQVILLDDAFQHRKVKAGFYILLTTYDNLFCNDFMLPTGNLRESRNGAKRADIIIVTKCPKAISEAEQLKIKKKIGLEKQIFFSYIDYDKNVYGNNGEVAIDEIKSSEKVLLAGIANPTPFFNYLKKEKDILLEFADHHHFTQSEIESIDQKAKGKILLTTEKDFVRLKNHSFKVEVFYLPIKSSFVKNKEEFDRKILSYVGRSTTNS